MTNRVLLAVAIIALSSCSSGNVAPALVSSPLQSPSAEHSVAALSQSVRVAPSEAPLVELGNLNYSNGAITVYHIANNVASVYSQFRPENGSAQGLAIDRNGLIYTAITNGKQCGTCIEVFTPQGKLTNTLVAPALAGAPGPASLNNVSVDWAGDVYVSDSGQEAAYYYPPGSTSATVPSIIVEHSKYLGGLTASPDGQTVVIGGCSFGSGRVYRRDSSGSFNAGACFSTPTISLIGSASDKSSLTLTPIDPSDSRVAACSAWGEYVFITPHPDSATIMSVAMNASSDVAYAADQRNAEVYVFSRPSKGWLSGTQPQLLATYTGFTHLDIIAVPQ
jgi:hypothetical protein